MTPMTDPQSLMAGLTPTRPDVTDGGPWELGTVVTIDAVGTITAIRFWKPATDTGPHTGRVWTTDGHLLVAVVFDHESPTGWQQQDLPTPIRVLAGDTVTVTVNTGPGAHFGLDLFTMPIRHGSLAAASACYGSPIGALPTLAMPHNYYRDLVFLPGSGAVVIETPTPNASVDTPVVVRGSVHLSVPGDHVVTITDRDAAGHEESSSVRITSAVMVPPPMTGLVQPNHLVLVGAHKLPHTPGPDALSQAYGGQGVSYHAAHDSLFVGGHDQYHLLGEFGPIPPLFYTTDWADKDKLGTAPTLQPLTDVLEGNIDKVGAGNRQIGGTLAYGGLLHVNVFIYYDGNGSQRLSLFRRPLDFAQAGQVAFATTLGQVEGPWMVDAKAFDQGKPVNPGGFTSGYLATIPEAWRAAFGGDTLIGNCCLSVIGRTSSGPCIWAVDLSDLGTIDPLPASTLVYYPLSHPLPPTGPNGEPWFNHTAQIGGVVFPEGTDSVLFFGRIGTGPYAYGEGTSIQSLDGTLVPGSEINYFVYDPADSSKGDHAYPYAYYVWAYDAHDLAAAKAGTLNAWDVRPYAVWQPPIPFPVINAKLRGVGYDAVKNRIFVSQAWADGSYPLINVFALKPLV